MNGKFELECYHKLLDFIREDDLAMESTRFVFAKQYRQSVAVLMLLRLLFQTFLENGGYLFTTGFFPNPGKLYVRKFGFTRHEIPFHYYHDDPQEVYLYYLNGYDRSYLRKIIDRFETILERKNKIAQNRS